MDHNSNIDRVYLSEIKKQRYPDLGALISDVQRYARQEGFEVVKGTTGKSHAYIQCKHFGNPRGHRDEQEENVSIEGSADKKEDTDVTKYTCKNGVVKRKPARSTMKLGCRWQVYASLKGSAGSRMWSLSRSKHEFTSEHTHELVPDNIMVYHSVRHADGDTISKVREMGTIVKPNQAQRLTVDNAGRFVMTSKDIYNINMTQTKSVEDVYYFLTSRGYTVAYDTDSNSIIKSVFVTHPVAIKRARTFPEVVIMDTTYKTNVHKMPMVNIVGIHNVTSLHNIKAPITFFMATAIVSNEKELSYNWVLKMLKDTVFNAVPDAPVTPGLFVTDDDKGLGLALANVFDTTPHILCAWHTERNFEAYASKYFKENDDFKAYKDIVAKMVWATREKAFDEAAGNYREIVKSAKSPGDVQKLESYLEL